MDLYGRWKLVNQAIGTVAQRFRPGEAIWEKEWDILCILDACRADTFREYFPNADSYWSVGSTSRTWVSRTFDRRSHESVAYVSANPYAAQLDPERFGYFHLEPVAETAAGIETVAPEVLRDRAVTAWRNRGSLGIDRLIIHFMQPHVPFRSRPEWFSAFAGTDSWGSSIWQDVRHGEISRDEFLEAYADNLRWVLEDGVYPLEELVTARVAVSADHGNAIGEWGLYGHHESVVVPAARTVPWTTFLAETSLDEFAEVELENRSLDDEELAQQLEALGYL